MDITNLSTVHMTENQSLNLNFVIWNGTYEIMKNGREKPALLSAVIAVAAISFAGIIMNILSIVVLLQPKMRSISINILLIGLQISDLVVVSTIFWTFGVTILLTEYVLQQEGKNNINPNEIGMLMFTATVGSNYFTALVSVERYIAVCHPLVVKILCSPRRAIYASIATIIFSILLTLQSWLKLGWGQIASWMVMEVVVIYIVPFLVLIILNIAIWIEFQKSKRSRMSIRSSQNGNSKSLGSKNDSEDDSLTTVLLSIVLLFVFCRSFILMYYTYQVLGIEHDWFFYYIVLPWLYFGGTLNSTCNFIFYCAYGTKFRNELKKVLKCG